MVTCFGDQSSTRDQKSYGRLPRGGWGGGGGGRGLGLGGYDRSKCTRINAVK